MPKVQISHDGFARQSVFRESVKTDKTCSWCGSKRQTGKLFQYSVENDDGVRANRIRGLFCSLPCMKAMDHR